MRLWAIRYFLAVAVLMASVGLLRVSLLGYASASSPAVNETALMETARTIGLGREGYVYSVKWGPWKVGRATLGATEIVEQNGRESFHIISSANSLPHVDTFYKVRDRNESWLDTKTFLSLGFGKYLREGRFYRHEVVLYDHEKAKFSATVRKRNGQIILENGDMKAKAYDVLSALYFVRSQTLTVGQEIAVDINTRKDWPMMIKVHRKERVKVSAGEFDCLVVEPMMREEGIFIQKGKSLFVWITDDARKIPVLMKAEIFIGSVNAELEEIVMSDLNRPMRLKDWEEPIPDMPPTEETQPNPVP